MCHIAVNVQTAVFFTLNYYILITVTSVPDCAHAPQYSYVVTTTQINIGNCIIISDINIIVN